MEVFYGIGWFILRVRERESVKGMVIGFFAGTLAIASFLLLLILRYDFFKR